MRRAVYTLTASLALLTAAPLLSGCGTEARQDAGGTSAQRAAEDRVALAGGWAKAAKSDGMTGVFGTLENRSERDLVIADPAGSVESDAAQTVELHEVTQDGLMRPIPGEVRIPAGGSFELAPGADHIMLMGLRRDLLAGEDVRVTIRFADGTKAAFTVPVKAYAGANERYTGDDPHDSDHSDDEHGGH